MRRSGGGSGQDAAINDEVGLSHPTPFLVFTVVLSGHPLPRLDDYQLGMPPRRLALMSTYPAVIQCSGAVVKDRPDPTGTAST
jgi:hypothetical protein